MTKGKQSLTNEEEVERTRYADQAAQALREAIAAGYRDFDHIQKDADFDPIREHPGFRVLIEKSTR